MEPEVQDALPPTSGFSAIGVCVGQVEGGARNCCFWFTGFLNCSENQKTSKPFCFEMSRMLYLTPKCVASKLSLDNFYYLIFMDFFKGKKHQVTENQGLTFGDAPPLP